MNKMLLATGVGLVVISLVYTLDIARRKGARFEYAAAMLQGELGLMFIAGQITPPGQARLLITLTFGVAIGTTMITWWRLFRTFRDRRQDS